MRLAATVLLSFALSLSFAISAQAQAPPPAPVVPAPGTGGPMGSSCSMQPGNCVSVPGVGLQPNPVLVSPNPTFVGGPTPPQQIGPGGPSGGGPSGGGPSPANPVDDTYVGPISPSSGSSTPSLSEGDPTGLLTASRRVLAYLSGPIAQIFGTIVIAATGFGMFVNSRRGRSIRHMVFVAVMTLIMINARSLVDFFLNL